MIPGFNVNALLGFIAPKGTPAPVILKIQTDLAKVMSMTDLQKRSDEFAMDIVASKPDEFEAFLVNEMKKWSKVINDSKITAD